MDELKNQFLDAIKQFKDGNSLSILDSKKLKESNLLFSPQHLKEVLFLYSEESEHKYMKSQKNVVTTAFIHYQNYFLLVELFLYPTVKESNALKVNSLDDLYHLLNNEEKMANIKDFFRRHNAFQKDKTLIHLEKYRIEQCNFTSHENDIKKPTKLKI